MSAISVGLVFLAACSPKPVPPVSVEDFDSREIWGGVSGFRVFAIKDATTRAGLGSFAVMDSPTPAGQSDAQAFNWGYGDQAEAWEWGGSAWPTSGFILDVEPTATRGTSTVNVFTHTTFPPTASNLAPPPTGGSHTVFKLKRVKPNQSVQPVGWLIMEKDATGALIELTWARDPAMQGQLIFVDEGDELHAIPVGVGDLPSSAFIIEQQP